MSAYEDRKELTRMAAELTEFKRQGMVILAELSRLITSYLSAADALLIPSADEVEAGTQRTAKKVEYHKVGTESTTGVAAAPFAAEYVATGKRACSLCRERGHRAKNCPNAHLIRKEQMSEREARDVAKKPKRTIKPLTEEQKAQRRLNLAKARAARGKHGPR